MGLSGDPGLTRDPVRYRFKSSHVSTTHVPDPAFESWLRDSGYLNLLDHHTSAAAAAAAAPDSSSASSSSAAAAPSSASDDVVSSITVGFFASLLSRLVTVSSLLTINPFSKLSADDFSGDTPPWTTSFFGACDSYLFPSSFQQARMRVHEKFDRHPSAWKLVIGIRQCATVILLTFLNVQMALFSALAVSYSVMLLHAGFRKLTPSKKERKFMMNGENINYLRR